MLEKNIQGIQHLGVPVTNLERSKTFYIQFGFKVVMAKTFTDKTGIVHAAMLKKDNLTVELYELPEKECLEIGNREDGHIDHIALDVKDIDQALKEIRTAGLDVLEENAPVFLPFWDLGVKYFTVRGPDGEKIEFNQIL